MAAGNSAERAGTLMSHARQNMITQLDQSIAELTSLRAALLLAERETSAWKRRGHPTFEAWRGQTAGVGLREARRELQVATTLEAQPQVAEAVKTGELTLEHANVIGKVSQQAQRRSLQLGQQGERELLDLAKRHDAGAFEKAADRWLTARDARGHDQSHEEIRRRRFLSVAHTSTGTHVKGFLDPIAGHKLRLALEAATPKPTADDNRDHGQRMADALTDLSAYSLASAKMKPGALVAPHISVILTEESFRQARAELRRRHNTTAQEPRTRSALPLEPITLDDNTPVPLTEAARILCEASVTRVVIDADDRPVNLGRTRRLFSGEQRRAVIARDRTCRFETCDRPARWCEVHHIQWWDRDDGETSVDNAVLLCSFHHHELHRGNAAIKPGALPVAISANTIGFGPYPATARAPSRDLDEAGRDLDGHPPGFESPRSASPQPGNARLGNARPGNARPGNARLGNIEARSADLENAEPP